MDRIGRYEIVQELGRGAMGAVYKAIDPQIDRTVAIKVILTTNLSPKDLENYKQRFYREARAAGKMSHGSIVTIYDITEDAGGQPYLVMEFVQGRTLESVMADAAGRPLPMAQALDIAKQVAEALDYAHRRGVVHRDVKPANILITDEGVAKIADFGIAKMEGVQLTQTGHMLGTPAFMSPEQFSGGEIDARSDLFSLGTILYWMLTGTKPFHADTLSMVTYKVVFAEPPLPAQVNPELPAPVNHVIARSIAKKPEARYRSCRELADDLESLLAGKPVKATPLSAEEQTVTAPPQAPELNVTVAPEKTQAVPPPQQLERTVAVSATEASSSDSSRAQPTGAASSVTAKAPASEASPGIGKLAIAGVVLALVALGLWAFWPAAAPLEQAKVEQEGPTKSAPTSKPVEEAPKSAADSAPQDAQAQLAAPSTLPAPAPAPSETASESGPPPHAKAKGRRERASAPAPVPAGPKATLHIECLHNFREGVLEISSGGRLIMRANLRGAEQGIGVVKIYNGVFNGDAEIPAGENLFDVRVRSSSSSFDESDQIGGLFREGSSRTMLIEFGKGSALKVIGRKLILRWK